MRKKHTVFIFILNKSNNDINKNNGHALKAKTYTPTKVVLNVPLLINVVKLVSLTSNSIFLCGSTKQ